LSNLFCSIHQISARILRRHCSQAQNSLSSEAPSTLRHQRDQRWRVWKTLCRRTIGHRTRRWCGCYRHPCCETVLTTCIPSRGEDSPTIPLV